MEEEVTSVEVWRCGGGRKNVEFSTQAPKAATYPSEGIYPFAPRGFSPPSPEGTTYISDDIPQASRHGMPGYSYLIPSGSGQKPLKTSIFDASRLKALNMNSPRQSLGRRM
jgi:hypothetical protein